MPPIHLAPRPDFAQLQQRYRQTGRVHIPGILPTEIAAHLGELLRQPQPWDVTFYGKDEGVVIDAASWHKLGQPERELVAMNVHLTGMRGFQYLYKSWALHERHTRQVVPGHPLAELYAWLNGEEFLNFLRELTDEPRIAFTDGAATLYERGDFLNAHHDGGTQDRRLVAYVLNLTREWRADWGGVLQFLDDDGHVVEGFLPKWNALNLFRVPTLHSVSVVSPVADGQRLSISGWARAKTEMP